MLGMVRSLGINPARQGEKKKLVSSATLAYQALFLIAKGIPASRLQCRIR